ncbi:MAG: GNAT family N-acetyltransferase [Planctomycetales bacterium]|nr:GNAT family N-acetyltransferase [Planctomycetales bacterium]
MNALLPTTTHVIEVNDIDALSSYRDEWAQLLAVTPDACFFQTLEWLTIYWRHFGRDQRLRTLLVYESDQLVGIVPLAINSCRTRAGAVRMLGYPLDGWGTRYGPIGENRQAILSAGLTHLRKTARDWDVLELNWMSSDNLAAATVAFSDLRVWPQVFAGSEVSLVDLTHPWNEYWTSLSSKHRNNVRRAEKRLATLGEVEMLHTRNGEGNACRVPSELYDRCEQLSWQSWQAGSATGTTLTHERVRHFVRDVHEAATAMGGVAIHLLSVNGEPAAFSYNYVFQGTEFGLRMGYAPKFKSGNPGTVLIHRMLQDCVDGPQRTLDFGEGDSGYKRAWRTQAVPTYRVCHYAKTSLRAQTLRWKRRWSGLR